MKRPPDWTKEEFEILIRNNSLSAESLSARLTRRTQDAIQLVRNGIHDYHQKGNSTFISKMMKEYLTKSGTILACPICGENIDLQNV